MKVHVHYDRRSARWVVCDTNMELLGTMAAMRLVNCYNMRAHCLTGELLADDTLVPFTADTILPTHTSAQQLVYANTELPVTQANEVSCMPDGSIWVIS